MYNKKNIIYIELTFWKDFNLLNNTYEVIYKYQKLLTEVNPLSKNFKEHQSSIDKFVHEGNENKETIRKSRRNRLYIYT